MGERLVRYYAFAKAKGGLALQIKLAIKTGLAEPRAAAAHDTPENVKRFHEAMLELVGPDPELPQP